MLVYRFSSSGSSFVGVLSAADFWRKLSRAVSLYSSISLKNELRGMEYLMQKVMVLRKKMVGVVVVG